MPFQLTELLLCAPTGSSPVISSGSIVRTLTWRQLTLAGAIFEHKDSRYWNLLAALRSKPLLSQRFAAHRTDHTLPIFFLFNQTGQGCKGIMRCRRDLGCFQFKPAAGFKITRVFVIVAVKAQQFPVATVRWIVVVIVITMVHRQLRHIAMRKFTHAAPTHPRIHLQRALAVAQIALVGRAPGGCARCLHRRTNIRAGTRTSSLLRRRARSAPQCAQTG